MSFEVGAKIQGLHSKVDYYYVGPAPGLDGYGVIMKISNNFLILVSSNDLIKNYQLVPEVFEKGKTYQSPSGRTFMVRDIITNPDSGEKITIGWATTKYDPELRFQMVKGFIRDTRDWELVTP